MKKTSNNQKKETEVMPLNRYLAHAGVCSRRQAVAFIKQGLVTVGDTIITEPGYKVTSEDVVKFKNKLIRVEKKIYILLNKPKDVVTTLSDEKGRTTVSDLLKHVIKERIYPVGRLDRATTGLLLVTNDGDLAQRLAHPSYEVKKVYHVTLMSTLKRQDLEKIKKGITLSDGFIAVDKISYVPGKSKKNIKVEIHSGKNRIVRRIFKHLGYNVVKLDRINYAGLTKKGFARKKWRNLTKDEIDNLKKFGEIKSRAGDVSEKISKKRFTKNSRKNKY